MTKSKPHKKGQYSSIPHHVIDSQSYANTSGNGCLLLMLMARQYNGRNNGNLTATYEQMKCYFASNNTLRGAIQSLLDNRLLAISGYGTTARKGGKKPVLYALTWEVMDNLRPECDVVIEPTTKRLRDDWKKVEAPLSTRKSWVAANDSRGGATHLKAVN